MTENHWPWNQESVVKGFLDEATGYNAKQRGDKAKEAGKKISKNQNQ